MLEWNRAYRAVSTRDNEVVRNPNERQWTEYIRECIRTMMRGQRREYHLKHCASIICHLAEEHLAVPAVAQKRGITRKRSVAF